MYKMPHIETIAFEMQPKMPGPVCFSQNQLFGRPVQPGGPCGNIASCDENQIKFDFHFILKYRLNDPITNIGKIVLPVKSQG